MTNTTMHVATVRMQLFLVFLLFLGLKLRGDIDWSWWLVTLPLWGDIALALSVLMVAGLAAATFAWIKGRRR